MFLFAQETSRCNETSSTLIDKEEKLKKMRSVLSYYNSVIMLHGFLAMLFEGCDHADDTKASEESAVSQKKRVT